MRVRLTLEADDAVCMESPYDAGFVQAFKAALPWDGRAWSPERKKWLISALYATELLAFLQSYGAQVQDDRASQGSIVAVPAMPAELKTAFDALHLAYTAPLGAAEAVYKFFARHWHPDMGGQTEDFQRINAAIAVIRHYLDPKADDDDIPF